MVDFLWYMYRYTNHTWMVRDVFKTAQFSPSFFLPRRQNNDEHLERLKVSSLVGRKTRENTTTLTLQEINVSRIPPGEKENHLQICLNRGICYICHMLYNSLEGTWMSRWKFVFSVLWLLACNYFMDKELFYCCVLCALSSVRSSVLAYVIISFYETFTSMGMMYLPIHEWWICMVSISR